MQSEWVPGRRVPISGGLRAFVPSRLPPPIEFSAELGALTSRADQALGGVAAIARLIPNPSLFAAPYLRLEAVLSSRIEGTQTTLSKVYLAEAAQEASSDSSAHEVLNYVHAMDLGVQWLQEGRPLSLRLVRDLHRQLVSGVRGANSAPGEWRTLQVHVGAGGGPEDATYVPPPANEVTGLLGDWEMFLHDPRPMPTLIKCAIMHAQFEMIHPFFDGNGRIGRLLISLVLMAAAQLPKPLLYLSPYLEQHRDEYYRRLAAISGRGDWMGWVRFFLEAVEVQSSRAAETAHAIIALREDIHAQLQQMGAPAKAIALADRLFERPIVTAKGAADELGVTFPTAGKYIGMLRDLEFVAEVSGRERNREFMAVALLTTIENCMAPTNDEPSAQPHLSL